MHSRLARAKVNLCLHVVGQRPDGYHRLESLVVFPELGDQLSVEPSAGLGLTLGGAYGIELGAGEDNLVIRAALALRAASGVEAGAALHLDKRLPVASGVGGGSADAAAALRLLTAFWSADLPEERLQALALELGADVPVCLASRPAIMRGIGEEVAPAPPLPDFWMVLANPGVAVATPEVFRTLTEKRNPPMPARPEAFATLAELIDWLGETRNDLEPAAIALRPVVAETLEALRGAEECRFARMSGSGATCFGLFAAGDPALAAADALRAARPGWWVAAAPVSKRSRHDEP